MGPKADGLRAMREANYDRRRRQIQDSLDCAGLKKAMDEAAARVAAKPKRKPKPFIPIDDTMLVPTGSLTKPKRKPARHK